MEVIRPILTHFIFFYEDTLHKKAYKAHKQLLLRYFYAFKKGA